MRNTIRYVPDGIELHLDEDDLGHPDGLDILQHHYRQSTRRELGFNGANPAFVCLTHQGGTNPGLFLKKIGGQWWAIHYAKGACKSHRLPAPMSVSGWLPQSPRRLLSPCSAAGHGHVAG